MPVFLSVFLSSFVMAVSSKSIFEAMPIKEQLPLVARIGEPYSWSFSRSTFAPYGSTFKYTTTPLPDWLAFNSENLTFSGTPAQRDEGAVEVTVTAKDASSSASSTFTICTTHLSPPKLSVSLAEQFKELRPSVSSVFPLASNSAIPTTSPALRIPPKWSFSIGFHGNTFRSESNIFYNVRLRNGSEPPDWMLFDPRTITIDGVVPIDYMSQQPVMLGFVLIASDQEGYSAASAPFDLVLASHELSLSAPPLVVTVNISEAFSIDLVSTLLSGLMVDGERIKNFDVEKINVDVSQFQSSLQFDSNAKTLSGDFKASDIGTDEIVLPATVVTTFNQSVQTCISLIVSKNSGTAVKPSPQPPITNDPISHPVSLSATSRAKLTAGLGIAFGVLGGLCILGGLLAAFRRWASVQDTAVDSEAGQNSWSEEDKKWYGIKSESTDSVKAEHGYGWTERSPMLSTTPDYGNLGLGLRRISERSGSDAPANSTNRPLPSPRFMSKGEFVSRIKETVRIVSDRARGRKHSQNRPIIGRPILRSSHQVLSFPASKSSSLDQAADAQGPPLTSFPNETYLPSHPGSTIVIESPSGSTDNRSIPRRRPDFAPPRTPGQAHVEEFRLSRQLSSGSSGSLASNSSTRTHAAEAVVRTASKVLSIRSVGSAGRASTDDPRVPAIPHIATARPRLVPFQNATRVPSPRASTAEDGAASGAFESEGASSRRVASQRAKIVNRRSRQVVGSETDDELRMGIHYVQSLGTDERDVHDPSKLCASVSSDSSHQGHERGGKSKVAREMARVGKEFRLRFPLLPTTPKSFCSRQLEVKLMSGRPLPKFLRIDTTGIKSKLSVECSGTPSFRDLGEYDVGIFTGDGICIARLFLDVVKA